MAETLEVSDYVTIGMYFVLVLVVGLWSTVRSNRDRSNATGYFLAGKTMHWFPVGASIFASNVGAPMFIGLAGTAAASGFAVAIYEWHAIYLILALGWIFVPVYVASGAFTLPEYLKKRFGGVRLRIFLSILALVLYIIIKISSEIYSGALFIQQILGWNMYVCMAGVLIVTAAYTIAGGMASVIYTDTLQTIILIIGATILSVISLVDVGGWNELMIKYNQAAPAVSLTNPDNFSCGFPRDDFMHVWRDPTTGDIPWTGVVFGLLFLGVCVWCTDQIQVQRCLSAKNMSHVKGGTTFAAALKITPFFLWIIPGMISRILFPDEVACADPESCDAVCGNKAGCSNIAYPLLVIRKLPQGLRGVMLAALLAALMSTLTSAFNSSSSVFTMDIWRRLRKNPPQTEIMIVGRVCVLATVALSILWVPVIEQSQGGQLWTYLQTISSCISPPWTWVFLLALFWKRTTEPGAFWGLIISTGVGFIRMVLEFTNPAPFCGSLEEDTRPSILKKIHFLHFSIIVSAVSIFSTVGISLLTTPRPPEKLRRVTWWTRHDPQDPEETESEDDFGLDEENEVDNVKRQTTIPRRKGFGRHIYNWCCGINDRPRPKLTQEEKILIKRRMTDIKDNPKYKTILNFTAVLVLLLTTFLLAFFH